jgi:hypothetical protein
MLGHQSKWKEKFSTEEKSEFFLCGHKKEKCFKKKMTLNSTNDIFYETFIL